MQRLTVAGRLLITFLILVAIYFGFKYIGGKDLLASLSSKTKEEPSTESPSIPSSSEATSTASATSDKSESSSSSSSKAQSSARGTFDFTPASPINGKLKGVVELGASGFNSFIVKIDQNKNWKLEKAEFGNSLVMENMATDDDIRVGLKKYISGMLDYGVSGKDIHFVVSSGAMKAEVTQKIVNALKSLKYFVNEVTPEKEGKLGLKCVQPQEFASNSFVVDIGSGNTKISWKDGGVAKSSETYGAKYFEKSTDDAVVYDEVKAKAKQIPASERKMCFILGGVPSDLAKQVRNGKERYTVLDAASAYKGDKAKTKAGINIYKAVADATGCEKFVFDWDSNFTIGFLLDLP
jgi:hypothetical protein